MYGKFAGQEHFQEPSGVVLPGMKEVAGVIKGKAVDGVRPAQTTRLIILFINLTVQVFAQMISGA
jgi:hypothetical protein